MNLSKTSYLNFLTSRHSRTRVGDRKNPLRAYLSEYGVTLDTVLAKSSTPKWVLRFVERVQARKGNSISANAAKNLLATI